MHRVDADSHVGNLFDGGDPLVPRLPTQVDPDWLNAVQEEIVNVILAAGVALAKGVNTQLSSVLLLKVTDQVAAGIKTLTDGLVATGKATTGNAGVSATGGTHLAAPGPGVFGQGGTLVGGGAGNSPGVWGAGGTGNKGPGVFGVGGTGGTGPGEASGVEGIASAAGAYGVYGKSTGGGICVYGEGTHADPNPGVYGSVTNASSTDSKAAGVKGTSGNRANATFTYGVIGEFRGSGTTGTAAGVLADGSAGTGAYGLIAKGSAVNAPLRLVPLATAPSAGFEGDVYLNSTDHKLYFHNGTTWIPTT